MRRWLRRTERVTAETARRITGISVPFGGISFADPGPTDAEKVRAFLVFLEDRRVLYNPDELEEAFQVEHSIDDIRAECTRTLQHLRPKAFAVVPIQAVRAAGRQFNDEQAKRYRFFEDDRDRSRAAPGFFVALGCFRAVVGQQVALLAAHYDLDVEGDLAKVLPRVEE